MPPSAQPPSSSSPVTAAGGLHQAAILHLEGLEKFEMAYGASGGGRGPSPSSKGGGGILFSSISPNHTPRCEGGGGEIVA